jgi:hypothetical protein
VCLQVDEAKCISFLPATAISRNKMLYAIYCSSNFSSCSSKSLVTNGYISYSKLLHQYSSKLFTFFIFIHIHFPLKHVKHSIKSIVENCEFITHLLAYTHPFPFQLPKSLLMHFHSIQLKRQKHRIFIYIEASVLALPKAKTRSVEIYSRLYVSEIWRGGEFNTRLQRRALEIIQFLAFFANGHFSSSKNMKSPAKTGCGGCSAAESEADRSRLQSIDR